MNCKKKVRFCKAGLFDPTDQPQHNSSYLFEDCFKQSLTPPAQPMTKKHLILVAAFLSCSLPELPAFEPMTPVEVGQLYRAPGMQTFEEEVDLAERSPEGSLDFSGPNRANFTYEGPGVDDFECDAKGLRFKTSDQSALLGWGNFEGRQGLDERVPMFNGWNEVEMTVRQTAESSKWTLELWADGSNETGLYDPSAIHWRLQPKQSITVEGTELQTVRFRVYKGGADGFGLTIDGPAGNEIRIESIRIMQRNNAGFFRREVEVPAGKVWRAVGEIRRDLRFFVNGTEVPVSSIHEITAPVDFTAYLKPGASNVLAIESNNAEPVYFQGRIIMEDGKILEVDGGSGWLSAATGENEWNKPGFDASSWGEANLESITSQHHFKRRWPVYDGPLLIENPGKDPLLYFDAQKPVNLFVRLPGGIPETGLELEWILRRVEIGNRRPEVARGSLETSVVSESGQSRTFEIEPGSLEMGVYTLELALKRDGSLWETRFEEPLVVVGRLPMEEVAGETLEEGLDLVLEQVIDFTVTDSAYLSVEAAPRGRNEPGVRIPEPRIVEKDGIRYRELGDSARGAALSYRFEFARPQSWYLMVLEYPNDAERWTGISVNSAARTTGRESGYAPWQIFEAPWSTSGPSIVTGGKYPLDDQMHEMSWLQWADSEIQTLEMVNLVEGLPAAGARVRIYRVESPLPAIKIDESGERFFGIHTERARSLGRTFADTDGMDMYQNRYDKLSYDMVDRFTQRLRWYFDAVTNYTEYLRFTGQNFHVMGAFQYDTGNTPYAAPERVEGDGRLLQDIRDIALRVFEQNGITMMSMVEYVGHQDLRIKHAASNHMVGEGADVVTFVSKDGEQGGWHINPLHPATEEGYLRVVDDLAAKFSHSPAWKGIYYFVYIDGGGFGPAPVALHHSPLDFCYSDATMAAFESDTGVRVPGEAGDPARFQQRYLFLTSAAMRDKWIAWRTQVPRHIMERTLETLHAYRPDLDVMYGYHLGVHSIRFWLEESGKDYATYFREQGMDPSVVADNPNLWFGRYIYPTGPFSGRRSHPWEQMLGKEPIDFYNVGPNRLVALATCWTELPTVMPGVEQGGRSTEIGATEGAEVPENWPMPGTIGRFIPQAHGDNSMEPFTAAMIGSDPDVLVFGMTDVNIINSREQQVRTIAKAITPLPKALMEPVLGTADFRHNLAVRARADENGLWFYAANPCPWPIAGHIVFDNAETKVVRASDGGAVEVAVENGAALLPVSLPAFGIQTFFARNPSGTGSAPTITSCEGKPVSEEAVTHLRWIIESTLKLLDDPPSALAITGPDRLFISGIIEKADGLISDGQYAAAWQDLTHWRLWNLRAIMEKASDFSARLPDRIELEHVDPNEPPKLQAIRLDASESVGLDGKLRDAVWERAVPNSRFLSIGRGSAAPYEGLPLVDSEVRAAYDQEALYLAFRLADPDTAEIRTTATPDNPSAIISGYDDMMVTFLLPPGGRVLQLGFNAEGVGYAARTAAWGVDGSDIQNLSWEVKTGIENGYWQAEVAVPFTVLEIGPPEPGDRWRANFIRRFREFSLPESYWAKTYGWGDADRYGFIQFQ